MKVNWKKQTGVGAVAALLVSIGLTSSAFAINQLPIPDPIPGSYGVEATKVQDPPTAVATVTIPSPGASFTESPITVSGLCQDGLLVQVYNNNVMVGSVVCSSGSFSMRVSLFPGANDITATMFDDLEQAGPTSAITSVTYTNSRLVAFGQAITLTSNYGRRSAPAGTRLEWPLQLSGGTGPYAFSIDWGDGESPELRSQPTAGTLTISHLYKKAGIYQVNITVTDVNQVTAFLQVTAVSSGQPEAVAGSESTVTTRTIVLWVPLILALVMLIPTYWLGRRSQLVSLRNKMLKERDSYKQSGDL